MGNSGEVDDSIAKLVQSLISKYDLNKQLPISPEKLCDDLGIKIVYMPYKCTAGRIAMNKNGAFIIFVKESDPLPRKRFTIGHELGHFFLHEKNRPPSHHAKVLLIRLRASSVGISPIGLQIPSQKEDAEQEAEADKFAAYLLMPEWEISKDVSAGMTLRQLAQKYNVSEEATARRLIGISDMYTCALFFKQGNLRNFWPSLMVEPEMKRYFLQYLGKNITDWPELKEALEKRKQMLITNILFNCMGYTEGGQLIVMLNAQNIARKDESLVELHSCKSGRHISPGTIEVVCGPMFAGKSTELLRRFKREIIAKSESETIAFQWSTYQEGAFDLNDDIPPVDLSTFVDVWSVTKTKDIMLKIRDNPKIKVIVIDNVHQFDPDLLDACQLLALEGKKVMVAGLDQNHNGTTYQTTAMLMAIADKVDKLSAVCGSCGKDATRTALTVPANDLLSYLNKSIYAPRCKACYYRELEQLEGNNAHEIGSLTVVCGPMFSGKSRELTNRYDEERIARRRVGVFKPKQDARSDRYIVTHDGRNRIPADVIDTPKQILKVLEEKEKPHLVLIDEMQFFNDHIADMTKVINSLNKDGINVVVATLDQDFLGKPWEIAAQLMAMADEIIKRRGVCINCGSKNATKSFRRSSNKARFLPGGADVYEAICSECFYNRVEIKF